MYGGADMISTSLDERVSNACAHADSDNIRSLVDGGVCVSGCNDD